eukprot:CAMPEP_0197039272 /NCGR_PEP_ID=MMETSP1384-20130603/16083_1 /TAXON_ID=29189 /ORGANISM="Ammonia sp." /LENGTH=306 /DNA_ID=CAMNT_0042469841 /DNA_START=114 /DNA_END=1034 /DNA_ORIENTATION=-
MSSDAKESEQEQQIVAMDTESPQNERQESTTDDAGTASLIKDEQGSQTIIISLPRDILTGYILCILCGRWKTITRASQICIVFGLVAALFIQFMTLLSFIGSISFDDITVGETQTEAWWFNLVALAVLFMYLWKDLIAFYNSTWFWLGKVEEEQGFRTLSRFTDIQGMKDDIRQIGRGTIDIGNVGQHVKFWQFRLALVFIFVLYIGLALYSMVAIGNTPPDGGLVPKIDIGVKVFFMLKIDDWAAALFILGPGVLESSQFDVAVKVPETAQDANKRVEKRLIATTLLLVFSLAIIYLLSNYQAFY